MRELAPPVRAVRLRPCVSSDFDAVLGLLGQLWPNKALDTTALRAVWDRALVSDAKVYCCAADDEEIVGFASLTVRENLWHEGYVAQLDEMVVDERRRFRGIGARLLEHLVEVARSRGCKAFLLVTAHHRHEAHRFYETHGFRKLSSSLYYCGI